MMEIRVLNFLKIICVPLSPYTEMLFWTKLY
uniref:Uncharacterized protein n=1 Tax=Rhizophora mucronata TaxID=61149 RepID=A0A2P2IHJ9_RHIMU